MSTVLACADCFDRVAVSNVAHIDTLSSGTCAYCGTVGSVAVLLAEYVRYLPVKE